MAKKDETVRAYDLKIRVITTSLKEAIGLAQAVVKSDNMKTAEARLAGVEDLGKTWRGVHKKM